MKTKLVALATALTLAGAAQAAEMQGPWIEARAGWDNTDGSNGLIYGATAGYDFAVSDKIFLGLQAGIADSTLEECFDGVCAGAGRDIEVLARFGGKVADKTALYAMAGYANSRFSSNFEDFSFGTNLDGVRAGVGLEQHFGSKTFAKLEYRYTSYSSSEVLGEEFEGGDRHQVSVSFGVRF